MTGDGDRKAWWASYVIATGVAYNKQLRVRVYLDEDGDWVREVTDLPVRAGAPPSTYRMRILALIDGPPIYAAPLGGT